MSMIRLAVLTLIAASAACGGHAPAPTTPKIAVAKPAAPSFGAAAIDHDLREAWKEKGIVPAPPADDATFLRRAYVDIVGTTPPLEVTTRFLADASPSKRAALVDALLASPEYAQHWTNYWDDVLMGRDVRSNLVDRPAFRRWLQAQFAENAPWNRIVTDLVTATGQNSEGGRKAAKGDAGLAMRLPSAPSDEPTLDGEAINGAVNWTLRFEQNPQDLGGTASRVFFGLQIQCAQCHDHKTESWKQDDFRRFSSAFLRTKLEPIDDAKMAGALRRVVLVDAAAPPPRFTKRPEIEPLARAKATALDGTDLERGTETRRALAAWMTSKNSAWFAKAFVNRMWAHFLGRGFVDPVDDIRPSNPATMPALLDAVAADFAAHDFDVRRLIRLICATEVYGLSASASAKTDGDNVLWGRFHLVPLGPEELLNAVFRVTALEETAKRAGIVDLEALRANVNQKYAFLFDTDEEDDEPRYSGTIAQALTLMNGELVGKGSRALPGSMIRELVSSSDSDTAKLDTLSLRVLGRHATADEQARWGAYVHTAETRSSDSARAPSRGQRGTLDRLRDRSDKRTKSSPKIEAYEDILWGMLNSSEFTFNH